MVLVCCIYEGTLVLAGRDGQMILIVIEIQIAI